MRTKNVSIFIITKRTNSYKKPLDGLQTPSQASDHTEIQKM